MLAYQLGHRLVSPSSHSLQMNILLSNCDGERDNLRGLE
jgi:hypothetical protein